MLSNSRAGPLKCGVQLGAISPIRLKVGSASHLKLKGWSFIVILGSLLFYLQNIWDMYDNVWRNNPSRYEE